jgi:uncharacterized protein YbjQ (UPF0145 family)
MLIVTVSDAQGTYDLPGYVLGSGTTLQEGMDRMQEDAAKLGAWGIVGMRLTISEETTGTSWVVAYGTAISQPR